MRCPKCGSKRTKWRSGVHFDNEQICYRCWYSFDPGAVDTDSIPDQPKDEEIEELLAKRKEINARLKELTCRKRGNVKGAGKKSQMKKEKHRAR